MNSNANTMEAGASPLVKLRNVSRRFRSPRGDVVALSDVSFEVKEGEFVTVVGPSGCGKSTVLNIIVGLLEATSGEALFRGKPITGTNVEIGYVTQSDNLFPWKTILENVSFGLELQGLGAPAERREKALSLMEKVGLKGFEHHFRHELSGGMRQRANIVRTLAYDPPLILLDEPFGPLDAQTRLQLQDLLLNLRTEHEETTFIFITHDLTEAIALADRVVVMTARPGKIREIVPVDLPRPRDIYNVHTDPRFREIYDRIWGHLADEMKGHAA